MKLLAAILLGLGMMGSANAALYSRAGGTMVYDDVLNITWLADWNYAYTSGYAAANVGGTGSSIILSDGGMGWAAANNWANTLVYGGFSDWRLPRSENADGTGQCLGVCPGSEFGHMFYVNWEAKTGGLVDDNYPYFSWANTSGVNTANLSYFSNIRQSYWTNQEYSPGGAWYFRADYGAQGLAGVGSALWAVAVRDGDVPVPATLALLGLGLAGLSVVRRRPA